MQMLLGILLCLQSTNSPIFEATGVYRTPEVSQVVVNGPRPQDVLAPKVRQRYLSMFTVHYCGPCQNWKRDEKAKVEAATGTVVNIYEMTLPENIKKYGSHVSRFPTFVIHDETEWLGDPIVGYTAADTLISMMRGPIVTQQPVPAAKPAVPKLLPPVRYIPWRGYGTIDLETYNRDCNCPMCQSIRGMQQKYWQDLKAYQNANPASVQVLPADQQPCPHAVVEAMLDALHLVPGDVLADLGCGDGRIVIAAARRGIRGIGVELDPVRAAVARQVVIDAGVSDMVTIETGDALEFDASRATVITAYLYPTLLESLIPKFNSVRAMTSPYHPVPGLAMTQIGDVWLYASGQARDPPKDLITVTPDSGKTTVQLRRTQTPGRFQFVP